MGKTERITVDEQNHFILSYHLRAKINVLDIRENLEIWKRFLSLKKHHVK